MAAYETIYQKNQDDTVHCWCKAYADTDRVARTIKRKYEEQLAVKDAQIAMLAAQLNQKQPLTHSHPDVSDF